MAAITPSTNLILLKNPNNLSSQNQLTFASKEAQFNYFYGLTKLEADDFTYQRKDYVIRFNACIDDILDYNYCMYQNAAYGNKWFYAYIINMKWLNDKVTEITIKTDVFQTFQFDLTYKACFVEREHVSDDTVGLHTIPEGLETGEYVCSGITPLYGGGNSTYICIAVTELPPGMSINTYSRQYNGIYSGVSYIVFETPLAASNFIRGMDGNGKGDSITSVFLIPTALTGTVTFTEYDIPIPGSSGQTITTQAGVPPYSTSFVDLGTVSGITSPSTINGYTPKNNKLFCHPYNYFYISNNVGMDVDFRYEDFVSNTAAFKTIGSITPGCSIKCFPLNYKKLSDTSSSMNSYNYGITAAKYPICSWASDVYTNWLTQNGVNIGGLKLNAAEAGILGGVISTGIGLGSMLAGNAFGVAQVGAGIGQILGTMQENYRHSLIPDSAKGNANAGDVTYSSANMNIPLYKMSIRSEYASCIDGYFSMYGYKVNTIKVPNITGRTYWNYVKTIGANIEGLIPEYYLDEIKSIFNAGITLWHDSTKFLDYTQNNTIVTP